MAKASSSSKVRKVTDPAAVRYLTDIEHLRYLEPFIGAARTVTDVAAQLEVKANSLLYRVNRMVELGLLEVERFKKRKGRAVKHYRSSADAFFVPYAATNAVRPEEWLLQWGNRFQDSLISQVLGTALEDAPAWGMQVSRNDGGFLSVLPSTEEGEPILPDFGPQHPATILGLGTGLFLDFADAKEFQKELHDLILKYWHKRGGQQYMLRVALAPVSDDKLPSLFTI